MSDETGTPIPEQPPAAAPDAAAPEAPPAPPADGPEVAEAWREVVARMTDLGEAVTAWAKAAADNPENRRHLEEVRVGVNDMASKAGSAFSDMSGDLGQQMAQGAQQAGQAIGDTAQKVSDAAAPHVASAFAGLADVFGRAAHRVDEAVKRQESGAQAAPAGESQPAAEPTATPPAPAPPAPPIPFEDDDRQ